MTEKTEPIILNSLIEENLRHLSAGMDVLQLISQEHYIFAEDPSSPWMTGVGKHFRHIIDFYDRFIGQFPVVNYDLRTRDKEIETDKDIALDKLFSRREALAAFRQRDVGEEIVLYQRDIPNNKNKNLVISSLGRELRYLIEHTVHHYAIIAMFLKKFGYSVPGELGVAQSTVDFEAKYNL